MVNYALESAVVIWMGVSNKQDINGSVEVCVLTEKTVQPIG
jgi:hypothetical protein